MQAPLNLLVHFINEEIKKLQVVERKAWTQYSKFITLKERFWRGESSHSRVKKTKQPPKKTSRE